jgi:hypothetical protein
MAGEEIRVTLHGPAAQLGYVQARDVARLIEGLEAALAASAYASLGTPRRAATGRHRAAIEAASRLRFRDVRSGSVVTILALPDLAELQTGMLNVGVDDLAGAALDRLAATFNAPDAEVDQGIARTIAELAESLGIGERHDDLVLTSDRRSSGFRLDVGSRTRMRRLADAPAPQKPEILVGSLREADFDRLTARLQTSSGETVVVDFPPELSDAIYDVLRGPAQVEGMVTFDPQTATARRVDVRSVTSPQNLPFGSGDFWDTTSVRDRLETAVPPDLEHLGEEFTQQERDDLLEALADLDA